MSDAPAEIEFLTVEVVLALHQRQLDRFGGGTGLRDRGLLESAVAQGTEVVLVLSELLLPVARACGSGESFDQYWAPGGPWA